MDPAPTIAVDDDGPAEPDTASDEAIARALQAAEDEAGAGAAPEGASSSGGAGGDASAGEGADGAGAGAAVTPDAGPGAAGAAGGGDKDDGRGGGPPTDFDEEHDKVSQDDLSATTPGRRTKSGHRRSKSGSTLQESKAAQGAQPRRANTEVQVMRKADSATDLKSKGHRRTGSSTSQDSFGEVASSTYKRMRDRYEQWREHQRAIANSIRELAPQLQLLGLRAKGPLNDVIGVYRTFFTKWEQLVRDKQVTVDAMAAAVHSAYDAVDDKVWSGTPAWAAVDEGVATAVQEFFERYLMEQLFELTFGANPEDEAKDLKLQEKIRLLRWIEPIHLKANFDPENAEVHRAFEEARDQLIMMDSQRAPHDKLERVVAASKGIFDVLQLAGGSPAGADDFMPLLIYTVIKANPPMLYSNLQYITRFSNQKKLNSGEAGYFYTNLYGAVQFVSAIDAESLQMSPREFHTQMQKNDLYKPITDLRSSEALLEALERLAALGPRQEKIRADLDKLNELLDSSLAANDAS